MRATMMKEIPVVVVTAKAQGIDRVLGLQIAGVDDYITKPFGPKTCRQCRAIARPVAGFHQSSQSEPCEKRPATIPADLCPAGELRQHAAYLQRRGGVPAGCGPNGLGPRPTGSEPVGPPVTISLSGSRSWAGNRGAVTEFKVSNCATSSGGPERVGDHRRCPLDSRLMPTRPVNPDQSILGANDGASAQPSCSSWRACWTGRHWTRSLAHLF